MKASILVLRAVSAVILRRILLPIAIVAFILLAALNGLLFYAAFSVDGWWALLFIILAPLTFIAIGICTGLWILSGKLFPSGLDETKKEKFRVFADKIIRLIDNGQTPYPIHLLLIGKDALRGKESAHVRDIINDSTSLKQDFEELKKLFD